MSQTEKKLEKMKALEVEAREYSDCLVDSDANPIRQQEKTSARVQSSISLIQGGRLRKKISSEKDI